MYWCAASSSNQGPDMIVAKWQSLSNHIQNKYTGHGALFPAYIYLKNEYTNLSNSISMLLLAAIHNDNGNRQSINKAGDPVFTIRFPQFKKGGYNLQTSRFIPHCVSSV